MIRRAAYERRKKCIFGFYGRIQVSLVNYVRQSKRWDSTKEKIEQSTNQADISWGETNKYYTSQMKEEFKTIKEEELY